MKRFEYSTLGKKLTPQTGIPKRKYQKVDETHKFYETINKNDKKPTLKKYNKLDLIYNSNYSFYRCYIL